MAYYSKTIIPTEINYPIYNNEILIIIRALKT